MLPSITLLQHIIKIITAIGENDLYENARRFYADILYSALLNKLNWSQKNLAVVQHIHPENIAWVA